MAHPRATSALVVLAVLVAAGCTGGVDNEVCKGRESFSLDFGGKIVSVEDACDECVTVLTISGQSSRCLETSRTMTASKVDTTILPDGRIKESGSYVNVLGAPYLGEENFTVTLRASSPETSIGIVYDSQSTLEEVDCSRPVGRRKSVVVNC